MDTVPETKHLTLFLLTVSTDVLLTNSFYTSAENINRLSPFTTRRHLTHIIFYRSTSCFHGFRVSDRLMPTDLDCILCKHEELEMAGCQ